MTGDNESSSMLSRKRLTLFPDRQCGWGLSCVEYTKGDEDYPCHGDSAPSAYYCIQQSSGRSSEGVSDNTNGATVLSISVVTTEGVEDIEVGSGGKPSDEEGEDNESTPVVAAAESESEVTDDSSGQSASLLVAAAVASTTMLIGVL